MKLNSIGAFFSKKYKSKVKKGSGGDTPSLRSTATASTSDDSTTPKTILRQHESRYPHSSAIADLFAVFDRDGDGKITKRELEIVLRRLSPHPLTGEEIAAMVTEVDRDGDDCISLEELRAIATEVLAPPAGGCELRDAFSVFDTDGDGKISAEELLGVFLALGEDGCTLDDCRRMIFGVDTDGDGYVCFEDFVRMMDGQR